MILYLLFDRVLGTVVYETVFFAPNDAAAIRFLLDNMRPETMLARHPEDFDLVKFGEWDPEEERTSLVARCNALRVTPLAET